MAPNTDNSCSVWKQRLALASDVVTIGGALVAFVTFLAVALRKRFNIDNIAAAFIFGTLALAILLAFFLVAYKVWQHFAKSETSSRTEIVVMSCVVWLVFAAIVGLAVYCTYSLLVPAVFR